MDLPEDIIVEILTRLPSKSVLRFKCVSKRWRLLLSSKKFITRHLRNSVTDPDLSHHHIIASPRLFEETILRSCSVRSIFDEPAAYPHPRSRYGERNTFGSFDYLRSSIGDGGDGGFVMRFMGSCNGLILGAVLFESKKIIVWNPAIRKANAILPPLEQVFEIADWERYCLGYDDSTDHYKVVRISIKFTYSEDDQRLNNSSAHTHIYSSGTCSWKKIESPHDTIFRFCEYSGRFVNGRLHWLTCEDSNNWSGDWNQNPDRKVIVRDIVCLDLVGEEEKYGIMGGPQCLSVCQGSKPVLKDLGGYLSLICLTYTSEINVWLMMNYGDPRSWTKILALADFDQTPTMETNIPRAMPLWLKKNRDMAVYFGPNIVIYNGKDKLHISPVAIHLHSVIDSLIYVESLVLPFGDQQHR